jgi:TPP-dependent trihydroxycyclohexane-1,2-dione (THcHDO) dehydratase
VLIERARTAAPNGEKAITTIVDKLEKVTRNWDRVAKPIQLSAKSRGIAHHLSRNAAFALRSLGVDLNNKYGMLDQADRITRLLKELFVELPEVAEKLGEDAEAIENLRRQALTMEKNKARRERDVMTVKSLNSTNKKEYSMKNWYQCMTKGQKKFVYFVSMSLVLAYGIGLFPLAVLIYLELGQRGNA